MANTYKHKHKTIPTEFTAGFLRGVDARTDLHRNLMRNYKEICQDLGGEEELSHIKRSLVERYVWLECVLQMMEFQLATGQIGKDDNIGKWIQGCNALSGLAKSLGLERDIATHTPWKSAQSKSRSKS